MESSECGVTAITSLPAATMPYSTLTTGLQESVETATPRNLAKIGRKDENMHGNPDSMQSRVLISAY